jgi:signal transduction histidine kinase
LPFYADKDHIVRILNNLIKNSIQAENNNKTIIIKVNISQIENNIILSVADNGCGINENMKDNIFKPYFTTKTSGTGLGLAMIHQIVESMNGKIYFEDEQPSGTKFTIEFNIK